MASVSCENKPLKSRCFDLKQRLLLITGKGHVDLARNMLQYLYMNNNRLSR